MLSLGCRVRASCTVAFSKVAGNVQASVVHKRLFDIVSTRRAKSSFSKLLFARTPEDTRPLLPDAILHLPVSTAVDSRSTTIQLDSRTHSLSNVFLRDSCQCFKCVNPSTTQKTFNTGDIVADMQPAALRVTNNALEVIWRQDSHRSVYPARLLSSYIDRVAATKIRYNDRVPRVWKAEEIAHQDIAVNFKSFMATDSSVHHITRALADYGLAFIEGCPSGPAAESELQKMVERIGPLKSTFYGPTWNVRAIEEAKNVAYTSVDLDLHMDLLYYESPPGLQFLHCLENKVEGGSSVFVDSFAVAEKMRADYPEDFRFLCDYEVDFKYENDGVYYHQARPTFVLNKVTGALEYVNYSPPFQGIMIPTNFEQYHRAISIFAKLLASAEYRYELVLKEGQCVVFNNRRTLHARRAFGPGARWLKGAYCDIDSLWSKHRMGLKALSQ